MFLLRLRSESLNLLGFHVFRTTFHSHSAQVYTSRSLQMLVRRVRTVDRNDISSVCVQVSVRNDRQDRVCSFPFVWRSCRTRDDQQFWVLSVLLLSSEMWRYCTLCLTHWIKALSQTRILTFDLLHCHNALKLVRTKLMLKPKVHWQSQIIITWIKVIFSKCIQAFYL